MERSETIKISDLSNAEILEIYYNLADSGSTCVDLDVKHLLTVFEALAKDRMQSLVRGQDGKSSLEQQKHTKT